MLVDSHAHLNFPELLADIDGVLARAKEAGVEKIINIGTSLEDSKVAIEMAKKYENLYATVGVHPNDDSGATVENVDWKRLEELAKSPKVIAIGECGLDYSRLPTTDYRLQQNEKERQRKLFLKQVEIAKNFDLPLSIHVRDAQEELTEILKQVQNDTRGVFHCFSGDQRYLEFVLAKGFCISFAGNVTFPPKADQPRAGKNAPLQELVKMVPMERLLVETDCPFLAPVPLRGSRNEPANVRITAQLLSKLLNIDYETFCKITTKNAESLFKI